MTALYPIARLNAVPLSRHLPQAPAPKPTMTPAEMAKQENIRAGLKGSPNYQPAKQQSQIKTGMGTRIFEHVRDNGPTLARDIGSVLGLKKSQVWNAIPEARCQAAQAGYAWRTVEVSVEGLPGRPRKYWVEKQ